MNSAHAEVLEALEIYLDALYRADESRIADLFHPAALYAMSTDAGGIMTRSTTEYVDVLAKRQSPASKGETKNGTVHFIEFGRPAMAFARVEPTMGPKRFTDFPTIAQTDGARRIISKAFHYELRQGWGESRAFNNLLYVIRPSGTIHDRFLQLDHRQWPKGRHRT